MPDRFDLHDLLDSPLDDGDGGGTRAWWWAVAGFALVLAVGVGGFLLLSGGGEEPQAAPVATTLPDGGPVTTASGSPPTDASTPGTTLPYAPVSDVIDETPSPFGPLVWRELPAPDLDDDVDFHDIVGVVHTGEAFAYVLAQFHEEFTSFQLLLSEDGVEWTRHPFEVDGWMDRLTGGGGELYGLGHGDGGSQVWHWTGAGWEALLETVPVPVPAMRAFAAGTDVAVDADGDLVGFHRTVWEVDWHAILDLPAGMYWHFDGSSARRVHVVAEGAEEDPVATYRADLVVSGDQLELTVVDEGTGDLFWSSGPQSVQGDIVDLAERFEAAGGRVEGAIEYLGLPVGFQFPPGVVPFRLEASPTGFVALVAGDLGETLVLQSVDGSEWADVTTQLTGEGPAFVEDVRYSRGRFVMAGRATDMVQISDQVTSRGVVPAVWSSVDGANWERVDLLFNPETRGGRVMVAAGTLGWVIPGLSACDLGQCGVTMHLSADGITWETVEIESALTGSRFLEMSGVAIGERSIVATMFDWPDRGDVGPETRVWVGTPG